MLTRIALLSAAALLFANVEAFAQTANAGAGAISGSASQAGAGAAAITGNTTFEGSASRMVQGDQTKMTVENVPDVIPPNIYHTNPCIISYSAGAGVVGVGASIGFGIKDENCQDINTGVFLAQLEQGNEAMRGMNLALHFYCSQNDEVRKIANMRGMADCGSPMVTAAQLPAAAVAPKPKPSRFSQTPRGQTICTSGFDSTTGQCAKVKVQAFVSDMRHDG